jgi:hypothetical protein
MFTKALEFWSEVSAGRRPLAGLDPPGTGSLLPGSGVIVTSPPSWLSAHSPTGAQSGQRRPGWGGKNK